MRRALLSLLALGALLAGPTWAAAGPGPGGERQAGAAHSAAARTVAISGFAYRPATVAVGRGASVRFANRDGVAHTATRSGGGFDSGRIGPGKAATIRFARAGSFPFHCRLHPSMKGKVVVR